MSNQELCTQYELIVTLLKNGNTDEVVKILDDAISRIKGTKNTSKNSEKESEHN